MKDKFISVIAAGIMIAGWLAGCSSNDENTSVSVPDAPASSFTATEYQSARSENMRSNEISLSSDSSLKRIVESSPSETKKSNKKISSKSGKNTSSSQNKETASKKTDSSDQSPIFDFKTKTVTLNSGYKMPIMGLGTYSLSDKECYNSVTALLNAGGRLIDTAYIYGNEAAVGRAVRDSNVPREDIFVITKLYPSQFDNPEKAIDRALKTLDIEYIDLMLLHHPGTGDVKAYKAMEQAVKDGKIHSIGLSNWYVEELKEFLPKVSATPALVQNEIHPYYQENDVIPYIQKKGIVVQGWYPFGGRGYTAELLGNKTISDIAKNHNVSSAQVILRWNLQKGVAVIPGSSNPEHIRENLDLFGFKLSQNEMNRINALDRNEKHDWY